MLRKLQPPTGQAARFADDSLRVGTIKLPDKEIVCLFNWDDAPRKISFGLSGTRRVTDFWSGENLEDTQPSSLSTKCRHIQPGYLFVHRSSVSFVRCWFVVASAR